jgi:hypothetical protein
MPDAMMLRTELSTLTALNSAVLMQASSGPMNINEVAAQAAAAAAAHMGLGAAAARECTSRIRLAPCSACKYYCTIA